MIGFSFSLAKDGAGLRRASKRMAARTRRATLRAVNKVGKATGDEVVKVMADVSGASLAAVKRTTRRYAAHASQLRGYHAKRGIRYIFGVRRGKAGQIPIKALQSKSFTLERRGGERGKLTFKQLSGQTQVLHVVRRGRGRGVNYLLPPGRRNRPWRMVGGVRFKEGETPSIEAIKRRAPRRVRAEFKRQLRRLPKR